MGQKALRTHPGQAHGSFRKMLRKMGGAPTDHQLTTLRRLREKAFLPGDPVKRAEQDEWNATPFHLKYA